MKEYQWSLRTGIQRSKEFERKRLATHSVNVGLKCGHACLYCSSDALLRCHPGFKKLGESPFATGYSIVDPNTPDRIAKDVHRTKDGDMIMFCSVTDPWSPEAQRWNVGHDTLRVLLEQGRGTVRVLTKNATVTSSYDLMSRHCSRVRMGLSITAPASKEAVMRVLEPNATPISERLTALKDAYRHDLRTYGMLCPCMPTIADSPAALEAMMQAVLDCGAEEVWLEPVNPRGKSLIRSADALAKAGFTEEAAAINRVRRRNAWNHYAVGLVKSAQTVAHAASILDRLHILLYWKQFTDEARQALAVNDRAIVWLGRPDVR